MPPQQTTRPPAWRFAAFVRMCAGLVGTLGLAGIPSAEAWASLTPGECTEYCEASTQCGPLATRAAVQQLGVSFFFFETSERA